MNEPSSKQLMAALIAAKKNFRPAIKVKENPHFHSRYADLAEVIDATQDALAEQQLVVIQPTEVDASGRTILVTKLMHSSGEQEVGRYLLNPAKQDPQGYAAALTYARRHCYMAILGIAAEDDDGNTASRPPKQEQRPAQRSGQRAANGHADAPRPPAAPKHDPAEVLTDADHQVFVQLLFRHKRTWEKCRAWLRGKEPSFPEAGKSTDLTYGQAGLIRRALEGKAAKQQQAQEQAS